MFLEYLKLGFDHILDIYGYDHILYVTVLCALYSLREWKKVLLLVTAFTVGHSLTLALAALDLVTIPSLWVERAIPVTILLTGVSNIWTVSRPASENRRLIGWQFSITLLFGLIHGLGFSGYFKAILGQEESIVLPLFAFNIGVEIGQLVIVGIVMALSSMLLYRVRLAPAYWTIPVSLIAICAACYLLLQR